ncbi:DUF488 domain-containing protein [Desulfovermiculus halophilus]|uniref:DUF488 domain-containing protein n=1 Tax=Desulfovermiculus halophilus TaxID=339722 RepID=UPI0005545618|nr:DUF488 family protein [Desulfovermiculus halophilus]
MLLVGNFFKGLNCYKERYSSELQKNPEAVNKLLDLAQKQQVTLLFAAKDTEYNHAVAIREYIISKEKNENNDRLSGPGIFQIP